jgi:SAM-dependent methyltransferase
MRADELAFPDGSFDVLLSRNVTWSLVDPEAAYKEWRRVLRPGGRLLIFDANWFRHLFDEEARRAKEAAERDAMARFVFEPFVEPDPELANELYSSLPMGRRQRPQWDEELLARLGYRGVSSDPGLSQRVLDERERALYAATPMFAIWAEA